MSAQIIEPKIDQQLSSGKPQLHYSSLETLWKCGEMFNRRYVKGDKVPPSASLHVGKGVDRGANENLQHKIDTKELLPVEQVVDIARDTVTHDIEDEGISLTPEERILGEGVAKAEAIDKTVRLARAHATKLAPNLKPARIQAKWTIEIPGFAFDIVGTRDLDEIDNTIRDLKTSKKSANKDAAETSDQLTTYAMSKYVVDKVDPPIRVVIDTIADLKREIKIQTLESTRTKDDFRVIINRIENAARILEKGAFTPARQTDWWCSTTYCGYATTCPYFRKPKSVFIEGE